MHSRQEKISGSFKVKVWLVMTVDWANAAADWANATAPIGRVMEYSFTGHHRKYISSTHCDKWKDHLSRVPVNGLKAITLHSTYNQHTYVCQSKSHVKKIISHLKAKTRMQVYCDSHWWRTGSCGGAELCVDCEDTCKCSSAFSYRPCILNRNWGGAGTSCMPQTQTLTMIVVGVLTTTTTTKTTTTTTTTKIRVLVKTFMLPEKIKWKIMRHEKKEKKQVCSGGAYTQWYAPEFPSGCELTRGTYTLHCMDIMGYGWSGNYLKIKGKPLHKDFAWGGKETKVVVTV